MNYCRYSIPRFLFIALVLDLLFFSSTTAANVDDNMSGARIFIESCQWQGSNPNMIRSGYGEYRVVTTSRPLPKKELEEKIRRRVESFKSATQPPTDERKRAHYERMVSAIPETIRSRNSGIKESRIRLLFRGNDFGGERRYEIENYDPGLETWMPTQLAIRGHATKAGGDNVQWDESNNLATLSRSNVGVLDFHVIGRMTGMYSKIITASLLQEGHLDSFLFPPQAVEDYLSELRSFSSIESLDPYRLIGRVQYDNGTGLASIVESRIPYSPPKKNGEQLLSQRYWIDDSRGHICPLIQLYATNGDLKLEWKSKDYFLHKESGLWFPSYHRFTEYSDTTGKFTARREYWLDEPTLKINHEISDDEFSINIPRDSYIMDTRRNPPRRYRTTGSIDLTFGSWKLLPKMFGVVTVESDSVLKHKGKGGYSPWIFAANISIVLILLGTLYFKYSKRTSV